MIIKYASLKQKTVDDIEKVSIFPVNFIVGGKGSSLDQKGCCRFIVKNVVVGKGTFLDLKVCFP